MLAVKTKVFWVHGFKTHMCSQLNLICFLFARLFKEQLRPWKIKNTCKTRVFPQRPITKKLICLTFPNFQEKLWLFGRSQPRQNILMYSEAV